MVINFIVVNRTAGNHLRAVCEHGEFSIDYLNYKSELDNHVAAARELLTRMKGYGQFRWARFTGKYYFIRQTMNKINWSENKLNEKLWDQIPNEDRTE